LPGGVVAALLYFPSVFQAPDRSDEAILATLSIQCEYAPDVRPEGKGYNPKEGPPECTSGERNKGE
jgi:hypothetical protein